MASVALGFVGFLLGLWLFFDSESDLITPGGALLAALLGVAFGRIFRLGRRQNELNLAILKLQNQVNALSAIPVATAEAVVPEPEETAPTAAEEAAPAAMEAVAETAETPPEPVLAAAAEAAPPIAEAPPPLPPPLPLAPREPDFLERQIKAARAWLFGGNTVARVGVVLLFLGLAFLLSYVSEQVTIPVELRYAAVGLAAVVLLVLGWRLRERRRNYGLMLQGGAVAILYLTIFAAMKLHPLIPPQAAFVMLVAVVAFSVILAVVQDALGLAAVAAAGGFAAPSWPRPAASIMSRCSAICCCSMPASSASPGSRPGGRST